MTPSDPGGGWEGGDARWRCVECGTVFADEPDVCPECGGEAFELVRLY